MPTYEYICPQCGVFEEFHGINSCLTNCPTCNGEIRRLISRNTNVIFKGSGFHITDYRSKEYSKKATTENSTGGSSVSTPAAESKSQTPAAESKSQTPAAENKSQTSEAKASPTQNKAS